MKKYRIEYREKYHYSPVSYWVHKNMEDCHWMRSKTFEPPLPKSIPCKGYPYLVIDALGTELTFSSIDEAKHTYDVLSQRNMPSTQELCIKSGNDAGPNSHWLSRFPSHLKPWRKRERYLGVLKSGINEFKSVYS